MQEFERLAIFTMIESIEHQLGGLKALVAGGAALQRAGGQKTVRTVHTPNESGYATPEEEARIGEMLEKQRQSEVASLARRAGEQGSQLWQEAAAEAQQ